MIGKMLGIGTTARNVGAAVTDVARVFAGDRAAREAADHERYVKALGQYSEEFSHPGIGWFDQLVNGLNRLPRPTMAVGTLGLFVYAMAEPDGFALRMQGLAFVPEPLWWLLGAIVSFYFGARELHHYRGRSLDLPMPSPPKEVEPRQIEALPPPEATPLPPPVVEAPARVVEAPAPVIAPPVPAVEAGVPVGGARVAAGRATVAASDPTDPHFNAAVEEWRRISAA
jgi:hypothetical protein